MEANGTITGTRIGHCRFVSSVANLPAKSAGLVTFQADRLRLAQLDPLNSGHSPTDPLRFVAEELAAVTMAWGQAKLLRDALIDAIERYEIANGELKWPALGAQNLKEARAEQIREERARTNRQSQLSFQ